MAESSSSGRTATEQTQSNGTPPNENPKSLSSHDYSHTKDFGLIPMPKRLRYHPDKPFHFGLLLNVSFGFASTFTVANLYYCQPLLIQFANSFGVTYEQVSKIPTLVQAGYATGLVLITPLGDLVRRRQLILLLVTLSTTLTIALAVTSSLEVFEAICFLVGMVTVTPQILLPLAADLAPPNRRASALSVVLSGLLLGVLAARVLAGVIAQFTSWRVVYYLALGVQCLVLGGIYIMIPDYPAKNKGLTYWNILWTMSKFAVTEPTLIQACLVNLASAACFANFWVTLTFLLGGPPYNYNTLVIGLFGLVGMFGVAMGPFVGKFIDKLVPWYASLVGVILMAVFLAIQTAAGGIHIAAVIIAVFGMDVFRQMLQVSLATAIFSIDPEARARLNAVYLLSLFLGQVMGTSAGSRVFVRYGWRWAAALNLFWSAWQLSILLLRGPHCRRYTWFGYEGGMKAMPIKERQDSNERKGEVENEREDKDVEKSARAETLDVNDEKKLSEESREKTTPENETTRQAARDRERGKR